MALLSNGKRSSPLVISHRNFRKFLVNGKRPWFLRCVKIPRTRCYGWWIDFPNLTSTNRFPAKISILKDQNFNVAPFIAEIKVSKEPATATRTPLNTKRLSKQKQWLWKCVLRFGTFLWRPWQNNNGKWPIFVFPWERERMTVNFLFFFLTLTSFTVI